MLITYFKDSRTLARCRSGLTNLYLENFIVWLESQGYQRFTIRRHVRDNHRLRKSGRRSAPRGCHALAGGGAAMLTNSVKIYLSVRRALGFKLQSVEKYLWSYANFATARGDIRVLSKTAVEWATLASSENQRANRLKVLIRFARFAHAEDSDHQIPPGNIFCGRLNRRTPYIFTDEEVKQLILHATRLGPLDSLRPHTYSTLFGLLASTGMRISEARCRCASRILPRKD